MGPDGTGISAVAGSKVTVAFGVARVQAVRCVRTGNPARQKAACIWANCTGAEPIWIAIGRFGGSADLVDKRQSRGGTKGEVGDNEPRPCCPNREGELGQAGPARDLRYFRSLPTKFC